MNFIIINKLLHTSLHLEFLSSKLFGYIIIKMSMMIIIDNHNILIILIITLLE